jgi:outer membrane lipoprotein LolB
MPNRIIKTLLSAFFIGVIQACSTVTVVPGAIYELAAREHLYAVENWSFQGRMAIHSQQESWSASLQWQHQTESDHLHLSGPLGQGATQIILTADSIRIDQGDGQAEYSEQPDWLIRQRLGIFVPVRALRYWVVGLVQPGLEFKEIENGFEQAGWMIQYLQFMQSGDELMPHKIVVTKQNTKLKLIIDQWDLL